MSELAIGSKLKFESDRQRFTVRAFDDRFVIATKPFNVRKTYLYTIVDLKRNVRGRCDLIFGPSYDLHGGEAKEALEAMQKGEFGVSHRHYVPLLESELSQFTPAEGANPLIQQDQTP